MWRIQHFERMKGYHAEESEAKVFAGGVTRLLNNVISSLTAL